MIHGHQGGAGHRSDAGALRRDRPQDLVDRRADAGARLVRQDLEARWRLAARLRRAGARGSRATRPSASAIALPRPRPPPRRCPRPGPSQGLVGLEPLKLGPGVALEVAHQGQRLAHPRIDQRLAVGPQLFREHDLVSVRSRRSTALTARSRDRSARSRSISARARSARAGARGPTGPANPGEGQDQGRRGRGQRRIAPAPSPEPARPPDRPRRDRPAVEEPPQVVGQRRGVRVSPAGSFSRHFRQIVSRSRGTSGRCRRGGTASVETTSFRVSIAEAPRNGGRPVSAW